jgi:hypothetical protein
MPLLGLPKTKRDPVSGDKAFPSGVSGDCLESLNLTFDVQKFSILIKAN